MKPLTLKALGLTGQDLPLVLPDVLTIDGIKYKRV